MFGINPEIKKFQKLMKKSGAEMKTVRLWCKQLQKMKKNEPKTTLDYENARSTTEKVDVLLKKMEQVLIRTTGRQPSEEERKSIITSVKELRKLSGGCDHIFVVSIDDREFHLTYDTIIKLGDNYSGGEKERLLLQSEVENLLALTKENLAKERPDMMQLTFFYLRRTDKELCELPPYERLAKVQRVFQHEFVDKMADQIEEALGKSKETAEGMIFDLIQA